MPLWVAIGADSKTGEQTIDCLCASEIGLASKKANGLGHFVSVIHLVDNTKSRLGKYSVGTCANWLKDNGHGNLALELLEINNSIPDSFDFGDARWLVPYFIAAEKIDRAWAAIQEAKIRGFVNSMYCAEAELIHLIELEYLVLKKDNRTELAAYTHAAERLTNAFLPKVPDREDFIDIRTSLVAENSGLDEDKLRLAAAKIYDMCQSKGPLVAIGSSVSIVQRMFSD